MNEELKIIIKAVTDGAKKSIQGVSKELSGLNKGSQGAGQSMMAFGKAAVKGAAIAVTAIAGVIAAVTRLSSATMEFREEQAKLQASFQSQGFAAQTASKTYKELYSVIGEEDTAVEAAQQIAMFARNEKEAAQMAQLAAGVIGSFGDALKPETFFEAANETLKLNEATGAFVQMLEGKGVSVDDFNAKLQSLSSAEEKRQYIMEVSNSLMGEAGNLYRKQAEEIIAYRNSQTELNTAMAAAGKAAQPLQTALNNLGASLFNALAPALNAIIPYLVKFVNMLTKAVNWVLKFFNVLTGGKFATKSISDVTSGFNGASSGANDLKQNTEGATGAAEKLKRATAGFDELNKVTDNSSASGSSGGGGSGGGGGGFDNGPVIDTSGVNTALDNTSKKVEEFVTKLKSKIDELKTLFQPTITSWSEAFNGIDWEEIGANFSTGLENIKTAFTNLSTYVTEEFIPGLTNSFSENLAPVFGDVFNFAAVQGSGAFSYISGKANEVINDIIIPTMDNWKTVATDVFSGIGDAWDEHGADALDEADTAIQGVYDTLDYLYEELVKPVVDYIETEFMDMWKNDLKPAFDNIVNCLLEIWKNLMELWNKVIKPIVDWIIAYLVPKIKNAIKDIVDKVKIIITTVSGVVSGITTTLNGIVKFITGIFTGNWKKAWEGVKDIFKGIFDSLFAVVKVPLNAIIGGVNSVIKGVVSGANTAIRALNRLKITVPDWVPGIGGETFGFNISELSAPQIPLLATGGIVTRDTLARIGEGNKKEAVLPLEQNTQWMDVLADRIAQRNGAPSKIVLTIDGKELGWASINSINDITKQTGNLPLAFA